MFVLCFGKVTNIEAMANYSGLKFITIISVIIEFGGQVNSYGYDYSAAEFDSKQAAESCAEQLNSRLVLKRLGG
jgi:hypothetical protein